MRLQSKILLCAVFLYSIAVSAQKVGINVNSPLVELDIRTLSVDDGSDINLGNLDNSHFLRLFSGRQGYPSPILYWKDGDPLLFGTNLNVFTERLRFASNGNVGLGVANPLARLSILGGEWNVATGEGDMSIGSATYRLATGIATSGGGAGIARIYAKGGQAKLILGSDNTDVIAIDSANRVGFGTISPVAKLDILGGQWNVAATEGDLRLGNTIHRLVAGISTSGGGAGITRIYAKGGQAKLIFGSDNTDIVAIDSANRVGVGVVNPNEFLEIAGTGALAGRIFIGDGGGANRKGLLIDAVEPGNYVRLHPFNYNTGTAMDLYLPGNVNIGQATGATGYKLSVDGKIIAEEMRIQISSAWPDYVFEEDYALTDLLALERSVRQNKHLPGIPPASEIASQGVLLGDMQVRMMQKIEELTLYIIAQEKAIRTLQNEIELLKSR